MQLRKPEALGVLDDHHGGVRDIDADFYDGRRNQNMNLAALKGRTWDVCIDNPTSLPFWVRDAGQVLKGNVGHYLFISTISVYADGSKPGIDENSPLAQYKGKDAMAETQQTLRADIENLYGPLKALSEAEAHKQFGKNVTIVRPGYIVGPRDETDRFTYWPLRVAEGGDVLVPGDGSDPVQFIDARDLQRRVQREGPVRDGDGVLRPAPFGQRRFEFRDDRPPSEGPPSDDAGNGLRILGGGLVLRVR